MAFASRYIEKQVLFPVLIDEEPHPDTGIIVMIPACNEPALMETIMSLSLCDPPACKVEVIVVVNEPENCRPEIRTCNDQSLLLMNGWKKEHAHTFLSLYPVMPAPFPEKHAGVGLARKTGMDEAVRRFEWLNRPGGVIVSLDADTLVERNYLTQIEKLVLQDRDVIGATIRFSHRISEVHDERQREGIMLYEEYLHYYKRAMAWCGYPHAIYTLGSAFAVKAAAYVKQGGMNQRKAGEDFYFLHKITRLGALAELNTTCVYPSARLSDRVPFGTGAALQKWMRKENELKTTYHFQAFTDLKNFFRRIPELYTSMPGDSFMAPALTRFLQEDNFPEKLDEIRTNCATVAAFRKRFFQYFDAFKILKFMNFSHAEFYEFQDLREAVAALEQADLRDA